MHNDASVPGSLERFLHGIIKPNAASSSERRCTAIGQSIVSACRPRSFISPILLSIAMYIHRKYASRELIDILSSLGFSANDKEVQRLNCAFLTNVEPDYNLSGFTQFVFHNADFNIATTTDHNTVHAMGGIACVTPAEVVPPRIVSRSTVTESAQKIGEFWANCRQNIHQARNTCTEISHCRSTGDEQRTSAMSQIGELVRQHLADQLCAWSGGESMSIVERFYADGSEG